MGSSGVLQFGGLETHPATSTLPSGLHCMSPSHVASDRQARVPLSYREKGSLHYWTVTGLQYSIYNPEHLLKKNAHQI